VQAGGGGPLVVGVDHLDQRAGVALGGPVRPQQPALAGLHGGQGLRRGHRAGQHAQGAAAGGPPQRHLAGVEAGGALLLVGEVGLVVDDDAAEGGQRGQHRRAAADHHLAAAQAQLGPGAVAAPVGQVAGQVGGVGEGLADRVADRGAGRHLRGDHDRAPPGGQRGLDQGGDPGAAVLAG
jgi:hypothetical protein